MLAKTLSSLLFTSCLFASSSVSQTTSSLGRLEPPDGKHYLAFWLDMNHLHGDDLPYRANARAGLNIPVFQFGQAIPVKNTLLGNRQANQTNEALLAQTGTNAAIYITLYPEEGLAAVTDDEIDKLVAQLKGYDDKGISVWLRFAPEMNGNWMTYSQTPTSYRATWIRIARALRAGAPNVALVFSPNMGYTPVQSISGTSPDFALFDTNNDGTLDAADDPYLPYYPGDEWVDWVGLSVYHFGYERPNLDNTPAPPGELENYISGHSNPNVHVNFYNEFAAKRNKPMMISESGHGYNPGGPSEAGLTEVQLKQSFWRQYLTNATFMDTYPKIKFMCQFEIQKEENVPPVTRMRDFRLTYSQPVLSAFLADLEPVRDRYIWATVGAHTPVSGGGNSGQSGTTGGNDPAQNGPSEKAPESKSSVERNVVSWVVGGVGLLIAAVGLGL